MGRNFKFQAQDSFLEQFFFGDLKNGSHFLKKKAPLELAGHSHGSKKLEFLPKLDLIGSQPRTDRSAITLLTAKIQHTKTAPLYINKLCCVVSNLGFDFIKLNDKRSKRHRRVCLANFLLNKSKQNQFGINLCQRKFILISKKKSLNFITCKLETSQTT